MATIDRLTKRARQWREHADRSRETIMRAAAFQASQHRLHNPLTSTRHLATLYAMSAKQQNWLEYGDVALHLVAAWPPDLAYLILYGLRELQSEIGYDPVPLVLKAVDMLPHLRLCIAASEPHRP